MLRKSAVALAVLGALNAAQVKALGLGEVTVHSALNQPLSAEIDLLQIRDLVKSQIIAGLADADDFYLAGVKPTAILSDINFQLDVSNGKGVIRITTRDPVREPFLNFLVEVNWPSGRLVREYTVLLDPPVFSAKDLAPQAAVVAPVGTSVSSQVARPQPAAGTASSAMPPKAGTMPNQYSVGARDTLWNIALKTRPDRSISPQQMMLALQRMNPDAFVNNNINRLKSGVVLDIPSKAQINAQDLSTSVEEVKRQNSAWKGASSTAKSSSKKTEQLDARKDGSLAPAGEPAVEQSQLRIVSKTPDDAAEEARKLGVSVDSEADSKDSALTEELLSKNQELEEQLVVTLEGLDKVERDNAELFQRMERLADQLESVQRLLLLRDQQMADLQSRLAESQAKPPEVVPAPALAPVPESPDSFLSPAVLGGVGAALLALLGGAFFFLRKRKQGGADDEQAVEDAMAVLEQREKASAANVAAAPVAAAAVAQAVAEAEPEVEEVAVQEDPDDPFNLASDDEVSDDFEALISDDLDQELGDALDMDLKIDEPVEEDPEMADFAASLLNDDEYDLAGDDVEAQSEAEPSAEVVLETAGLDDELEDISEIEAPPSDDNTAAAEAEPIVDDLDSELDFILAEAGDADADIDSAFEGLDADADLDMILEGSAEGGEALESADENEGVVEALGADTADAELEADALDDALDDGLGDGLGDNFDDGLDAALAEAAEDTDEIAAGSAEIQNLMDDAQVSDSSGLDVVDHAGDGDDEFIGEDLDALLGQAAVDELSSGEDALDAGAIDDAGAEASLEVASLDAGPGGLADEMLDDVLEAAVTGAELSPDADALDLPDQSETQLAEAAVAEPAEEEALDFGELDALDDELALDSGLSLDAERSLDEESGTLQASSVDDLAVGDDDLSSAATGAAEEQSPAEVASFDEAGDDDLEAELSLMLEGDDNELALDEMSMEDSDEELNYLDASDELGTKLDLARAYIDMDDPEGAKDILDEVIRDGDNQQQAEARKLLEGLA